MNEKREHNRHHFEEKVCFEFIYDFKAHVDFQEHKDPLPKKLAYHGTTCNVSIQGLCFMSEHELHLGDVLDLKVFVPGSKKPVTMQGEVRWNKIIAMEKDGHKFFHTGVRLFHIGKKEIADTIYYDEKYKVFWSDVLEALLGTYRVIQQKKNDDK